MLDGRRSTLGATWGAVTVIMFACCIADSAFEAKFAFPNMDSEFSRLEKMIYDEEIQEPPPELRSFMKNNSNVNMNNKRAHLKTLPKCVELIDVPKTGAMSKGYTLKGSRWNCNDLTYNISSYPKGFEKKILDKEISRAFDVWSNYSDLTFSPVNGDQAEIKIRFAKGNHGDDMPFYGRYQLVGPGDALAHAFEPSEGGEIHFNLNKDWTIGGYGRGYDFFYVAVHEIGHSLGLGHSDVRSAIMYERYREHDPNFTLDDDDIRGLHALYGPKTRDEDPDICEDTQIDTIFNTADDRVYIFKGNYYWRVTTYGFSYGYPKPIAKKWKGLPGNIDAAFTHSGWTYFFKGSEYWVYSNGKIHGRYPRKIRKDFPGIPDNIDAATVSKRNGMIYFYKGANLWRFYPIPRLPFKSYPESISNWQDLPAKLDAAFSHNDGTIYFFLNDGGYYQSDDGLFIRSGPYNTGSDWFRCYNQESNDVL